MKLPKAITDLMGKKVTYCRAKPDAQGNPELFRGEGVIVGVIVGATRRVQIMVKDIGESANTAFTLDLMCVNYTEEDAQRYFAHHQYLQAMVKEHNDSQKLREQQKIKEVDELNYSFFGEPLDI